MSAFDRPPPERVTPERVRALLAWLSHRGRLADEALARVPGLVAGASFSQRDWAQDLWLELPDGEGLWFRIDAKCGCPAHEREQFCEHRAALLVLELWRRPEGRALFDRPCWSLELDYLLREGPRASDGTPAQAPARSDRPCQFQIDLYPTGGYERGFDFDLQLIRANKRGDGWLKPIRGPSSLAALLAKAAPSELQLRVFELASQLRELRGLDTFARRAPRMRAWLAHETLTALSEAGEELALRWEGLPIRASSSAWRPTLQIVACDDGRRIQARWRESLLDHWRLEPSIVLTANGVLRPLASDIPVHLLDRVNDHTVTLDAGEFDALAKTILALAPIPIEVPAPATVGAAAVARREPRLYLEERGELLRVTAKLVYELADGRSVEFGIDDRGGLSFAEQTTLIRDGVWEQRCRDQVRAWIGREHSVELLAEGAWSFLCEGLACLREAGWVVFGQAGLRRNRVLAEPLSPRLRIGPSTDWFALEIDFAAEGDETITAAAVIDSWIKGERFVRLADDRVAALPARWLERHGQSVAELVELRRDAEHGRLGLHAVPLAGELLDELVSDDPTQAQRASSWRAKSRALAQFEGVADRAAPAELQATLREYQRRGFAWLCFLRDHGLAGCLADDMGLGKTIQALALLLDTHRGDPNLADPRPSLIVCPTSVLHTWREQAAKFAPQLRVHVHHGPRRQTPPDTAQVIVTSYALLRHDAQLWRSLALRHLIFDEAQALKNPDSLVAKVARSLHAAHPLALSGTPLENNVVELWSLFELLMPGFFGSRRRFRRRWVEPIHKHEDAAALARLRRRLRPFLLRRLKREVAAELPPKQTQILRCRLGKDQREMYERVRQTYRSSVLGAVDARGVAGATLHILEALTRLRQACCHPALLPFPEAKQLGGRVAKLDLLRVLLTSAIADGHRSLVFSQWPSFLDLVAADLREAGVAHLRLDGRTRDRAEVLDRWRDPAGAPVFLISTKAGGVGLDLTEADHVFHLDPWWNPATEDQATDRAHRIGQDRPVMVYKLVAADTVEDKILELQARKRRLFRATVDADRLEVDELRREDLEAVFADPDADSGPDDDEAELEAELLAFTDLDPEPDAEVIEADKLAQFVAFPRATAQPSAAEDSPTSAASAEVLELFPRRPR